MTNPNDKFYIGIDISKHSFDCFCSPLNKHQSFPQTKEGFALFIRYLQSLHAEVVLTCEATGGYEKALLLALYQQGLEMNVVNPRHIHHFARAAGFLAKTDKLDAKIIALFAERMQPAHRFKDLSLAPLQELARRLEDLKAMTQREKNHLEHATKITRSLIKKTLNMLEKQIREVEDSLQKMVQENEQLQQKLALLESYKGVGKTTAMALLIGLPELGHIEKKTAGSACRCRTV